MTSGSWSVSGPGSSYGAAKSWFGTDGKYEVVDGKKRARWNHYQLSHNRWTQSVGNGISHAHEPPNFNVAQYALAVNWTANDDLRLLNKLAEKIKGHSFDLGINMAEAGRSYNLVLSNLHSIGSGLVNLKRGNVAGAFRELGVPGRRQKPLKAKDVSGRWLEMQYGWRPLVDQAFEASKALESATKPRTLSFTASSSRTIQYNCSSSSGLYEHWVRITYSKRIKADLYEPVSLARSLGLTNPAAIAWEVVPYSFVVDWFLPVGSYLSAWGIIPALRGRFLTSSRGTQKGSRIVLKPGVGLPFGGTKLRQQRIALLRSPTASLSVPAPTFNSIPQALSPARLYNAVALIHQRLR